MSFIKYLKDKLSSITISLLLLLILGGLLYYIDLDYILILIICGIFVLQMLSVIFSGYRKKKKYYKQVSDSLERLENKYEISSILPEANFLDGKILYDFIQASSGSVHDKIYFLNSEIRKYKDFSNIVIKEVDKLSTEAKTYIDCTKDINSTTIYNYFNEISNYVEKSLIKLFLEPDADIFSTEILLSDIINPITSKNTGSIIKNKIKLSTSGLHKTVNTEPVLITLIINQLLSNSIKYRKENAGIKIYTECDNNYTVLHIEDNGVGMSDEKISEAFSEEIKSSLYYCKKLAKKINAELILVSKDGIGTRASIAFPIKE